MSKAMFIPIKNWDKYLKGAKKVNVGHVVTMAGVLAAGIGYVITAIGQSDMWAGNIPRTEEEIEEWGISLDEQFGNSEEET